MIKYMGRKDKFYGTNGINSIGLRLHSLSRPWFATRFIVPTLFKQVYEDKYFSVPDKQKAFQQEGFKKVLGKYSGIFPANHFFSSFNYEWRI